MMDALQVAFNALMLAGIATLSSEPYTRFIFGLSAAIAGVCAAYAGFFA